MEQQPAQKETVVNEVADGVRGPAVLAACAFLFVCFAGPFLLVAYQAFIWLRDGYWDGWPVVRSLASLGIYEPTVDWLGVQRIVRWLFDLPTALALPMIGVAALWVGGVIMGWFDQRERAR